MTRTRLMVAGLLAGGMLLGTGCSMGKGARMEPAATTHAPSDNPDAANTSPGTGGSGPGEGKSSTGLYQDYAVPQEDRGSTGGSGYEDAVTNPGASDTSNDKRDIRDEDPAEEPGTGGSGYEKDSDQFKQNQEFGGSRFPGDNAVPQRL